METLGIALDKGRILALLRSLKIEGSPAGWKEEDHGIEAYPKPHTEP